jgi:hypothetical protein
MLPRTFEEQEKDPIAQPAKHPGRHRTYQGSVAGHHDRGFERTIAYVADVETAHGGTPEEKESGWSYWAQ